MKNFTHRFIEYQLKIVAKFTNILETSVELLAKELSKNWTVVEFGSSQHKLRGDWGSIEIVAVTSIHIVRAYRCNG